MSAPAPVTGALGRTEIYRGVRFILLAWVCLVLMVLDHREGHLDRIRQALALVVYPIQVAVDFPFTAWDGATRVLAERDALLTENERLKRERLGLDFRLQRLAALETENVRLRGLLDSTAELEHTVRVAEVLAVDLDPYRQRLTINRGDRDGVFIGQAMLDAKGVVGQIVDVGPLTAEAVLITDPDHGVPVTVNRNGLRTIAVGTGDAGRLLLPYLTNSADIEIDDLLVSSGMGGVFPSGFPVGRVLEVRIQPGQSFAEVIAEPASELDRDQEVLLVWMSGQGAPSSGAGGEFAELDR